MRLHRTELALLGAVAATVPLSIFASQLLLALCAAVLVLRLVLRQTRVPGTVVDAPLLAFAVWSLLSASFAADPARAHEDSKKLLLIPLFYLAVELLRPAEERQRVLDALLLGGSALAALMVMQHYWLGFDELSRRPAGFLGHYMSASGIVMAVLVLASARLAVAERLPRAGQLWLAAGVALAVAVVAACSTSSHGRMATRLFVAAMAVLGGTVALSRSPGLGAARAALPFVAAPLAALALVLSQTRGAWLGAFAGLATIALLRAPRALALVAAAAVLVALSSSAALRSRLTFSDASSVDRYYMWQAGVDMVVDRPVFGQGPGMIIANYPSYRWPEAPNPLAPHLHNNVLQLAAERGLPGLAFAAWLAAVACAVALRELRLATAAGGRADRAAALGALAVVVATFAAGLFEYNLGDSEVLMLVLLAVAVPFTLTHARNTAAEPA